MTLGWLVAQPVAYAQDAAASTLPLDEIMAFSRAYEIIKESYVDPIEDDKLLNDAIRGMIAGLDPHSAVLEQREVSQLQINTSGKYGGLGMEVTKEGNAIRVVSPFDDSPAYQAGIRAGDFIIRLDGMLVDRMDLNEAVNIMRGEVGTDIKLTIVRQGRSQPLEVTVTRRIIKLQSVRSYALAPKYGYVRITGFQSTTASLLENAINDLLKEQDGLNGLVLDLRNNPGGELRSAVEVSDAFINDGLILTTRGRGRSPAKQYNATQGDLIEGTPVVVLVNQGSASASEIVAGALQDHNRAIVMGERTFGKGSVQTLLQVNSSLALKLTTQRYYTPKDRSIQASGIEPDIVVPHQEVEADNGANQQAEYRESDLTGALENETRDSAKDEDQLHPSVTKDYQLQQALSLLKGLSIARTLPMSG